MSDRMISATFTLALVGCGGESGGPVTVSVAASSPGGVEVYFQGPDSALLGQAITDASGDASGPMEGGGFVSLYRPIVPATTAELHTFAGVEPGDDLALTYREASPSFMRHITFPASTGPNVFQYQVFGADCSIGQFPPTVTATTVDMDLAFNMGCVGATDLIVISFNSNIQPLQWGVALDVSTAGPIRLDALTYADFTPTTVSVTDIPAEVDPLSVRLFAGTSRGPLAGGGGSTSISPTFPVQVPVWPGALVTLDTFVRTESSTHYLLDAGPHRDSYELQVAGRMVRDATSCPTYARAERTLVLPARTDGVAPNVVAARIQIGTEPGARSQWNVVGPPDDGGMVLPELPAALEPFQINSLDFFQVEYAWRGAVTGGHRALAASGTWLPDARFDVDPLISLAPLAPMALAHTVGCPPI